MAGRQTKSDNEDKNKPFNNPKKGSTKSTPDTSEATMILVHSTYKKSRTYSGVLVVLTTKEEENVTSTDKFNKRLSRNRTVGRE